jgi:hypothetical protein
MGFYLPSNKFSFRRSYVYEIAIARYGDTVTHVNGRFTIHAVPPDPTVLIIQTYPNFWNWNSNGYTLDHIVTECFALAGGVGPEIPINFTLQYGQHPTKHRAVLEFLWYTGSPDFEYFPLPVQPPHWWMPPPLP